MGYIEQGIRIQNLRSEKIFFLQKSSFLVHNLKNDYMLNPVSNSKE